MEDKDKAKRTAPLKGEAVETQRSITVRLTDDQYFRFTRTAADHRMSTTEYLKDLIELSIAVESK